MHDARTMIRTCLGVAVIAGGLWTAGCSQQSHRHYHASPTIPSSQPTVSLNPPHASAVDPYTPTRLEWLIVKLQAGYRKESTHGNFFTIGFAAGSNSGPRGVVIIYVYYLPPPNQPDMRIMKEAVAGVRDAIRNEARNLGMDVEIREEWGVWDWTPPQNRPEVPPPSDEVK